MCPSSQLYKPAGFPSMPRGKDGKRQCRSPSIYQQTRDPRTPTLGKFVSRIGKSPEDKNQTLFRRIPVNNLSAFSRSFSLTWIPSKTLTALHALMISPR